MPDHEFIAGRIRWRASKHGLPDKDTYAFTDAPPDLRSSVNQVCRDHDLGVPVLVLGSQPNQWTTIGTRSVVSFYNGAVHHCVLAEMTDFHSGMPRAAKQEMEYLHVTRTDGAVIQLWAPPGPQFFALWNILLGLSRMNLSDTTT